MADIYLDVDTAVAVAVNKVPIVASADFTTIDETIAYNESGMDLNWNFITSAGVQTQTNVTPTTGGVYDWTHVGNGMYKIEIPASGGGSINNDTEGYGWFSGIADAILPFVSPVYCFRAAALNDALCDGGDLLDVNVTQIGGAEQSATDLKDFADTGYDPSAHVAQADMTYIHGSALTETAGQLAGRFVDFFDEASATFNVATALSSFKATGYAVAGDAMTLTAAYDAAKTAAQSTVCTEARLAELDGANLPTDVAAIPTNPMLDTEDGSSFSAIPDMATATNQSTIAGYIDTEIGAITDHLTDIKGTGFVKDTHSLPQCLTGTGTSTLDAAGVRTAVGLASANLDTQLGDIPTVAEFNARTLVAASYFDPAADAVANVTTVGTVTNAVTTDAASRSASKADVSALALEATLGDMKGATFSTATDSLEAIRDRGDVAWVTGGGGSAPTVGEIRAEMDSNSTQLAAIVADTNEMQTDLADGGRLDLILDELTTQGDTNEGKLDTIDGVVDAILLDTGTDGVVLSAAQVTAIADAVLKRGVSNTEATADQDSLTEIILAILHSSVSGNTWTIKKTDDTTTFEEKTVTADSSADPITGVSG